MVKVSEALQIAAERYRAGRPDLAEEIYRRILAVEPEHAEALHRLGVIAYGRGDLATAASLISRAADLDPQQPAVHNNLGEVWRAMGRTAEAVACYRRAVALDANYAVAHNNLGIALLDQGDALQAIACFQRAIELSPRWALPHYNLGMAWDAAEDWDQAIACYERAVAFEPGLAAAWCNLGSDHYRKRRYTEAVSRFREAIRLDPQFGAAYNNLGVALVEVNRPAAAIEAFAAAARLKPPSADMLSNLGLAYQELRLPDEALRCFRAALELEPGNVNARNSLGGACEDLGMLDEAQASYREALRRDPDFAVARSNFLCALRCDPEATLDSLKAAHAEYERVHAAPLRAVWRPHANVRQPERVLRLGFVSPRFAGGAIESFLIRTLENVDRAELHVTCYSDSAVADEATARFRAAADAWHDVYAMTDDELAERIRGDAIDLLVDLAGHAPRNRLLVFARKPAPLQFTWIDSVGTTGLAAIDYLIADRHLVPPGAEPYYAEKVLRLPDVYVCYAPAAEAPPVGALPALARGRVTFGSFNRAVKLNARVVAVWSKILRRLPEARLVLKYSGLEGPGAAGHFRPLFKSQGIDGARVEMQGHSPPAQYLEQYNRVDVTLDPFPHNGGLTTCDSLWMGVPVVTCPGATFAGRQSLSHLSAVGLTETIACDLDEYVEIAVRLASDLPRLADLRGGLRERMAASPLCNGRRFAESLTVVLRTAWRDWCLRRA